MAPAALTTRLVQHIEFTMDCWLWRSSCTRDGYGQITFGGEKHRAHRFVYALVRGPIPDDMQLDHLCQVKRCVNPAHLEVVTGPENTARWGATITHCPKGHVRDGVKRSGRRYCKTCDRERHRKPAVATANQTGAGPGDRAG